MTPIRIVCGEDNYLIQTASATAVTREILTLLHPTSVADVGSGDGAWSKAIMDAGVNDVIAVDGPWVNQAKLKVPHDHFLVRDLSQHLSVARSFDLVLCLETAEHLPPSRAASFVEDLTRLASAVVFSAAIPGQGGAMHVNEQWPDYWAKLFDKQGFVALDVIRPRLWNNQAVAPMYRQNMLLYVKKERHLQSPGLRSLLATDPANILSLVHPLVFRNAVSDAAQEAHWQSQLKRRLGLN